MLVTDMWKIYRESSQDTLTSSSIVHFSDALAYEMIQQVQKDEDKLTGDSEVTNGVCISVDSMDSADASTLSCPSGHMQQHQKVYLKGGKQLHCMWCSRINLKEVKTTLMCQECGKGFCRDDSGRTCWYLHVANGGVPQAPKRGLMKQRREQEQE